MQHVPLEVDLEVHQHSGAKFNESNLRMIVDLDDHAFNQVSFRSLVEEISHLRSRVSDLEALRNDPTQEKSTNRGITHTETSTTMVPNDVSYAKLSQDVVALQGEVREIKELLAYDTRLAGSSQRRSSRRRSGRQSIQERTAVEVTSDIWQTQEQELYLFKESTWDMAFFIWTPSLGVCGSCITTVQLLMTVIMQTVFVGIVWFNLAEAVIDETTIEDARRWRSYYGHDYQSMNLLSGYSLVTRVCQDDKSLQIASAQQQLYKFVGDYVKPGATGLESIFVGQSLCIVALVCWFLMVSKEANDAVDLFRAIVHLDRRIDKLLPNQMPGFPTRHEVASVSCIRVIFNAAIVLYRLAISGCLCYCGTFFLVYTIEITELVLNAVALEVILNMDEIVYHALTTANARKLVLEVAPLCVPRWLHRKGLDLKAVSITVIIPCIAIIVYCEMIVPMMENLNKTADALCGGTQNFVFSEDRLKMTIFASSSPCRNGCEMPVNASTSVKSLAVQEVVKHGQRNNPEYAIWVGDHHDLKAWNSFSFEQLVSLVSQGECVDSLRGPHLHYMRQVVGSNLILDCNAVQYWCSSASFVPEWGPDGGKGLMARLFCPRTCECDNPGGSQIFISGCPAACKQKTDPVYAMNLKTNPTCVQRSARQLRNSSDWIAWVSQIRQFAVFKNDQVILDYSNKMSQAGCNGVDQFPSAMCLWEYRYASVLKSLAFLCPRRCSCSQARFNALACPVGCAKTASNGFR